jgi:hypothetical protein
MCSDNTTTYALVENISLNKYAIYKILDDGAELYFVINTPYSNSTQLKMTPDGDGGFWIIANVQINNTSNSVLFHITYAGTVDYSVTSDNLQIFNITDNFKNVIAYNPIDNILAIVKNNIVELYNFNNTNKTLTNIASGDTLYGVSDMTFDFAGNLYVIDNDTNKLYKYRVPTAANRTTPAQYKYRFNCTNYTTPLTYNVNKTPTK